MKAFFQTDENVNNLIIRVMLGIVLFGIFWLSAVLVAAEGSRITTLTVKDLADLNGKEGRMLIVEFAPGFSSDIHGHNAHTFVYVLEGSVVMQVRGGKAMVLGPGQTFYESPTDIHEVSKNASESQSAKFLVFFVKDKGAPLVIPAK